MRSFVDSCDFWQALAVAEQARKACQNRLTVRVGFAQKFKIGSGIDRIRTLNLQLIRFKADFLGKAVRV